MGEDVKVEKDHTLELLAALVQGDRWLSADACAAYLGMFTPGGAVNRRGFLERVACRPEFPKPNPVTRTWKKSEVDDWADEQRRASRAA
jgi:predicted DNA-binding transcriptional regulator AlpA